MTNIITHRFELNCHSAGELPSYNMWLSVPWAPCRAWSSFQSSAAHQSDRRCPYAWSLQLFTWQKSGWASHGEASAGPSVGPPTGGSGRATTDQWWPPWPLAGPCQGPGTGQMLGLNARQQNFAPCEPYPQTSSMQPKSAGPPPVHASSWWPVWSWWPSGPSPGFVPPTAGILWADFTSSAS